MHILYNEMNNGLIIFVHGKYILVNLVMYLKKFTDLYLLLLKEMNKIHKKIPKISERFLVYCKNFYIICTLRSFKVHTA